MAKFGQSHQRQEMSSLNEERPKWITIQMNTFTNWLNQQLSPNQMQINDLESDLGDGVLLIQVVETLQSRLCTGKIYRQNPTEIQKLMNVQMALDALREDRVKLVNIGSQDIVGGNLKLILGLIWCLIQRYQIASHSKIPPKKLIMAWLQSILPEIKLTNFRVNWNDGIALSALIDYCQPGLFPDWQRINPMNATANCAKALHLAEKHLDIPAIISAEHLSSSDLDELSCITYLSYFVKRGGPGYRATMDQVRKLLPDVRVTDFEHSWNDGYLLARLVEAVGGSIPDLSLMNFDDRSHWPHNISTALNSALELGIASLIGPDDIADVDVEHLGILALSAALISVLMDPPAPPPGKRFVNASQGSIHHSTQSSFIKSESVMPVYEQPRSPSPSVIATTCYQLQQLNLDLAFAEGSNVNVEDIDVVIIGPEKQVLDPRLLELQKNRTNKGAVLSFIPKQVGKYEVHILCERTELPTSPILLNVLAATQRHPVIDVESRSLPSTNVSGAPSPPPLPPQGVLPKASKQSTEIQGESANKLGKKISALVAALDQQQNFPLASSSSKQTRFEPITGRISVKSDARTNKDMDMYDQQSVVSFSGLNEPCSIGSIVEVVINAQGDSTGDVLVFAESPSGRQVPCTVTHQANSFTATFTPNEVGDWQIGILYDDEHIKGSPFNCQVYDANLVQVYGLDVGLVGQELRFTVDASRAGVGDASVSILRHGKQIGCEIEEEKSGPRRLPTGKFRVHFTPSGAGQYKIHIAFNNMEVKGSPFILDIADVNSVSVYGDNLRMAAVDRLSSFMVHAVGIHNKDLSVIITGPSNKRKHGRVIQIDDGTFRVEWKPIEVGEHLIDVRLYEQSVYESPFVCNVGDPELVSVKHIPQCIDTRHLNKDHSFEIDASAAGSGNLEIVINGGRVACRVREISPRNFVAHFTPTQRVPHTIEMKFNGEHVRGSPWTLATRESSSYAAKDASGFESHHFSELVGVGLHRAAVGVPAVFEVSAVSPGGDASAIEPLRAGNVAVKVFDPEGRSIDTRIREQPNGVRCEYTLRQVGDHRLEVYINDRLIDSGELYVAGYDPRQITIEPVAGSTVGQPVQFLVDAVHAGKGQLEISVNQGRVPNNVQMKDAGRCLVTFIPQHAGVYVIDVTFNGHQIHGCPIRVEVHSKQVGKPVSTSTTATSHAASSTPTARITGPGGIEHQTTTTTTTATAPSYSHQQQHQQRTSLSHHGIAGASPPPPSVSPPSLSSPPSNERTSFPAHSPRLSSPAYVDTSFSPRVSAAASRPIESPKSPPLVRHTAPLSPPRLTDAEGLKSPRLLRQTTSPIQERTESPRGVGYTIAHYGDHGSSRASSREDARTPPAKKYFGEPAVSQDVGVFKTTYEQRSPKGDSGVDGSFSPEDRSTSRKHKYFETEATSRYDAPPKGFTVRTEETLTVTAGPREVTGIDYHSESRSGQRFEPIDTRSPDRFERISRRRSPSPDYMVSPQPPEHRHETAFGTMSSNIYDEIPATSPPPPPPVHAHHHTLDKTTEMEPQPLDERARRTADFMRVKEEDDRLLDKFGYGNAPASSEQRQYSGSEQEQAIIEPYPSDLESLGPQVRQKLESQSHEHPAITEEPLVTDERSDAGSKPSSKPTTPKLSLKFGRSSDKNKDTSGGSKVFDFGKSKITSKHEVIRRGRDVEVKIDNLKLSKEDSIKILVTPPTRRMATEEESSAIEIPHEMKKSGKTYYITFRPTDVGTHKLLIFVNGQPHPQAPFPIRVYDASQIIVGEIVPESIINDTVEFTVDAGRAGFGNLEMAIKDHEGTIIPSHVSQLESGSARFLVTFNPTSLGTHTVNVTFNKEVIKGSPFEVKIVENLSNVPGMTSISDTASESPKKKGKEKKDKKERNGTKKGSPIKEAKVEKIPSLSRVGKPAVLQLSAPVGAQIEVVVTDSSRRELPCQILEDDKDSSIRIIQFCPEVVGDHEIAIKVNGLDVENSPFVCRVHDPAKIKVGEIPNGFVNKAVCFVVDASESGVGNLEVAVNDGTIPSMARALGHHKYEISFVPLEAIDHKVSIRFNNEPVSGSPFTCYIKPQVHAFGPGLERVPVGKSTEFTVQIGDEQAALPEVTIVDSRGDKLPVTVSKESKHGDFIVEYTPKVVGNHQVEVRYNGELIGSPFVSKAFDAAQAKIFLEEPAKVGTPCTFVIDAAKAGAGNMEIIVSVDGRNVPNYVQAKSQAKFEVSFTPNEPKEHIISVKFNGQSIPGSPMKCPVVAAGASAATSIQKTVTTTSSSRDHLRSDEEIRLVGDLAMAQVGKPKGFSIDSPKRNAECNVVVTGPNGRRVKTEVVRVEEGFDVHFVPHIVGDYEIDILLDGKSLSICPIVCSCTDADLEAEGFVTLPDIVSSGEHIVFEVRLGAVNKKDVIRVEVCAEDGTVLPCSVRLDRSTGVAKVSCLIPRSGSYYVDVYRNNIPVGDRMPFNAAGQGVADDLRVTYIEKKAFVDRPSTFELTVPSGMEKELHVEVLDADSSSLPVSLSRIEGNTFSAEWVPMSEGEHTISVKLDGIAMAGTPLKVSVLDLSAVRVIGLKNDAVGVQQRFNIDWSSSGGSNIAVSITHEDGEATKCSLKKVKPGLHVCTFTPKRPGLYLLNVLVDDVQLPECPYECFISSAGAVRARGDALFRAQRGKTARFEVSLGNATRGELDVLVTDALQGPLPVRCYKQQDDSYWVEFTPEQTGVHQIEVTFGEVPVSGSPFKCEVVDPKKVIIKHADEALTVRHIAKLAINRRAAGNGPLEVEVLDPQGTPLKVEQIRTSNGDDQVTFLPVKLGIHRLSVKLAGFQVPGTPKQVIVEEQGKPAVYGAALERTVECDSQASIIFDPKKSHGGLKIDVRGPEGEKIRHSTNKRPDGLSEISFRPTQVGMYKMTVEFNNKPVSGSPFQVNVVDAKKVLVNDENVGPDGLLQLKVGQKNPIDVDTTAAGPGKLRVEVRDADGELKPEAATVQNLGYGKHRAFVTPERPGNVKLYFYWSEHVVVSAYPLNAIAYGDYDAMQESTSVKHKENAQTSHKHDELDALARVELRGEGLKHASVKNQAEFIIDGSDVPDGKLSVQLIGEKADIPVRMQHLGNNVHKAVYTPLQGGDYELHVKLDGHHVRGSPSTVVVRTHSTPAELVEVDQKTLKIGIIGEDVKTVIDTRKAGSGFLSSQCVGPSKLAYCELYDHRDGTYLLSVKPTELGKHTLVIKYSNEHVPGSPFVFNVSNPPDPSKVKVYGPGVDHGILHSFKSNFIVETKGAGAGQLTVRVRGPKGAFNVEMQRDQSQDRTIHCKYEPREPGDYQVEVKWHGQHVPGSPFFVMIVDTEEELRRFLAGDAPSQVPATPFIPPGWVGPPPPLGHHPPPMAVMSPGAGYPPPPMHGRRFYGPPPPMFHGPPPAAMHPQGPRRRNH